MTAFLILAAGNSTRFDGDKLRERFNGYTLPQYAAQFAIANGATRICVTLSNKQVYTNGHKMKHSILDDLRDVCDVEIALQPTERYGTGAAVAIWQQRIDTDVVILFGDNLYRGTLPTMNEDGTLFYSTITRKTPDARNLRLAAVVNNIVIEKPHQQTDGTYFAGFVKQPAALWGVLPQLQLSTRHEYEIADIINFALKRQAIDLSATEMTWGDITSAADVAGIAALFA